MPSLMMLRTLEFLDLWKKFVLFVYLKFHKNIVISWTEIEKMGWLMWQNNFFTHEK